MENKLNYIINTITHDYNEENETTITLDETTINELKERIIDVITCELSTWE